MHFLTISFRPLLTKILVKCQQATASDLPFYNIFAPQKVPFLKISDDVIARELWFGPPPIKNPGYAYGCQNDLTHYFVGLLKRKLLGNKTEKCFYF